MAPASSPEPLVLTPHPGPDKPTSSTPGVGLFPGAPVQRYEFTGAGRAALATGLEPGPGTVFRVAVHPELLFDDARPDALPNYSSTFIGVVAATAAGDQPLLDQHHWGVHPGEPGALVTDQWNLLDLDLADLDPHEPVDLVLVSPGGCRGSGWLQVIGPVPAPADDADPVDLVRTTRGSHQHSGSSLSRGNTFPLTSLPHGFHFLTPVTDARSHRWFYSWHGRPNDPDPRPTLQAMAVSHCPSPWMGDRLGFQVMSWTGRPDVDPLARERHFDHADELDRPHHYRVRLDDGVVAEMAPTSHAAIFRFDFIDTAATQAGVVLDMPGSGELTISLLADGRASFTAMINPPADWQVDGLAPLAGYVYGETRQPVEVLDVTSREGIPELPTNLGRTITRRWPKWLRVKVNRSQSGALRLREGSVLEVVLATSQISTQQARDTLAAQIGQAGFEQVVESARSTWSDLLDRLEITGGTHDQRVTAWSNLARLYSWPNEHHEPGDTYASPFQPPVGSHQRHHTGATVRTGRLHVNNGYWDTFRTCWPAYHLLTPRRAGDLLDGIVQQYLDGGWMARWSAPGYCDIMVGTSSDAVFADASAHGLEFNELAGYDSALRNATVPTDRDEVGRKGLQRGRFRGFIDTDTHEGLSWSLDNANSDAALARWSARLAERAGSDQNARRDEFRANAIWFAHRAMAYQHLFDPATGFFRARMRNGEFRDEDFDPTLWGRDYTETTAWGMAFHAPFDGAGLARLYGGEDGLAAKLHQAEHTPETGSLRVGRHYGAVIHEMLEARALRLGQFAMSNQPAHHIPFMWTHTGQHHRTQWLVREILERGFTGSQIGQGYPGDEDNGEMSAWWLLAAAGLYPLAVGSGELVLTAPLFERLAFRRDDGTLLEVRAGSVEHRFIQSLTVNGEPWDRVSIPVEKLHGNVTLQFELGPEPSGWATGSRPGSISDLVPEGALHTDLTTSATVVVHGRDGDRGTGLCDDLGEVETLRGGETLELTWEEPVTASIWTLTCQEVAAAPLRVEVCRFGHWQPVAPPRPALWHNQTQAYLLFPDAGPDPITGLRLHAEADVDLRQVEVYR
ncbi:GH92 family glycosyl hydrolase [Propionibacteriaceae bacterium Y1923]